MQPTGRKHNGDAFEESRTSDGGNHKRLSGRGGSAGIDEMECGSNPQRSITSTWNESFDLWWSEDGRFYDPDTVDVSWFDKRKELAAYAWLAAKKNETTCEL